jgi:membrane protein insertase Oxa1/YidC/SpoIIIJ
MIGLPWPMVIMMSCVFMRCTILPLLFMQIKRMSRLAPLSPVLIHVKDAFKNSDLPLYKRGYLAFQAVRSILK